MLLEIFNAGSLAIVKVPLERHGNFLKVMDFYNGDVLSFFHIEKDVPVFNENRNIDYNGSELKIYEEAATSDTVGVVVSISTDDVGNKVLIKGIDGLEYNYQNLFSVSVSIYDYVTIGDIIGTSFYDEDYYYKLTILDV